MLGHVIGACALPHFTRSSVLPLFARRGYNPQVLVDMKQARLQERARELQLSERRLKTFVPALDHFRLTKFGWEHKKAGSCGERKRKRNHKASLLATRIGYVNPRDHRTMRLYFPHMSLRSRKMPLDTNVNIHTIRTLLPAPIC